MIVSAPKRLATVLAAAAAGLAAAASPASAITLPAYTPTGHECSLTSLALTGLPSLTYDTGAALTDPLGYQFDTTSTLLALWNGQPFQYATLAFGGSKTAVPNRTFAGAYANWGDLYVGSTESRATQYLDNDPLGCNAESAGRQIAFAKTTIGGLGVQRKLSVPGTGVSGARLVESVSNPTSADVTTNVYVGDMTSSLDEGTLGSGSATKIGQTSSGDSVVDGDDHWAVTYGGVGTPALAHVWDGAHGAVTSNLQLTGAQPGNEAIDAPQQLGKGQFGYGWRSVTIPAGGTASFLSWELMRASTTTTGTGSGPDLAATAASNLSAAAPATIFQGMTAAEIASVQNWPRPAVDATLAPVSGATSMSETAVSATSVDFGSTALAQCDAGTVHWDFGDGTSANGMGGAHRVAAGPADVTVTVTGNCGGTLTKHLKFWVEAPVTTTTTGAGAGAGAAAGVGGGVSIDAPSTGSASADVGAGGAVNAAGSDPAGSTGAASTAATSVAGGPSTTGTTGTAGAGAATDPSTQLVLTALPKIAATQIQKKGVDATVQSAVGGSVRFVLTGTGIKMVKVVSLAAGGPSTTTLTFPPSASKALKAVKTLQLRAKLTLASGAEIISTRPITVHH